MKTSKKIMFFLMCQLFFVLWGCGGGGPCREFFILKVTSPDGVSIGSYSGEILKNGKYFNSFSCQNDQRISEIINGPLCGIDNLVRFPADYYTDSTILSIDVIVYSFNKEMKSQNHFDLKFKYPPNHDNTEGCEQHTIEVILQ